MEADEKIRDWAIEHRQDDLAVRANQSLELTVAEYLLAKVQHERL